MPEEFEPKIIGFICKWCTYAAADLAGTSRLQYPPSFLPIRVMCSSRVDPLGVIKTFLEGADGVLIGGCHPGDCHYVQGNYYTRRRFVLLQAVFAGLGLEAERLQLSWISASEGVRFAQVVRDYARKIKNLGPNPTKREIFL